MCGISGIVSLVPGFPVVETIRNMNKAIAHRGPDGEGFLLGYETEVLPYTTPDFYPKETAPSLPWHPSRHWSSEPQLAFGHRRLSILDLHLTGHQPLCDVSKRYWITYNGELYNYRSLRTELESKGHQFFGTSDTEVLLHAYMEWGSECLQRFDGMWAFAIYDVHLKKVFAARDRFGVKPFYYFHTSTLFGFCSEIKGLLEIPGAPRRINQTAAFQYLAFGLSEENEQSLFEGITELMPGELFELNCRTLSLQKKRYYTLSFNPRFEKISDSTQQQLSREIYEQLKDAVSLRANADVTVGACLSGGLDSSALVSLLLKTPQDHPIPLFTSVFPDSPRDESHWAKILGEHPNANWIHSRPDANAFTENFTQLIRTQDLPFYSMTAFTHFQLMKDVHQHGIKVVLDGQGADELFGGYHLHYSVFLRELWKHNPLQALKALSQSGNPGFSTRKKALEFISKNTFYRKAPKLFFKRYQQQWENHFFTSDFWNEKSDLFHSYYSIYQKDLNAFLAYQFGGCELKTLLRVGDRNSMHHSVETRTPFADSIGLIETAFSISASVKIQHNTSKYLLREALKGTLPEALRKRKDKIGFATPEHLWANSMKDYFRELLSESLDDPLINVRLLSAQFDEQLKGSADLRMNRLWRMLNYLSWKKEFQMNY